jgi:hypothetical protein
MIVLLIVFLSISPIMFMYNIHTYAVTFERVLITSYRERVKQEVEALELRGDALNHFNAATLNKLNTLEICIKETLRLTAHTIGSIRKTRKPFSFKLNGKQVAIPQVCFSILIG